MRHSSCVLAATCWFLCATAGAAEQEKAKTEGKSPGLRQAELEKQFAEMLSGTVLSGSFTTDGEKGPPKTDRYVITKVTKIKGDLWLFTARVQYGGKDRPFSFPLPVKWAGDTPVITITDFTIPGLGGAFSVRTVFHRGRYAGTWQHGKAGGHMWGKIEKSKAKDK